MSHDAYSALSDPTRRRILAVLQDGARPVGDLVTELGVSQPTVSKHLKVLRDAGMVTTRAQGQKRFYSIVGDPLVPVVDWLTELVAAAHSAPDDAATPAPQPAAPQHATPPTTARPGDSEPAPAPDDAAPAHVGTEPAAPAEHPAPVETAVPGQRSGLPEPAEPAVEHTLATAAPVEREDDAEEPAESRTSVTPGDDAPASPEPLTGGQSMPWSTAEVPELPETPEAAELEEQDGAVEQEDQGAVVVTDDSGEASQETPEDGAVTEAEGEPGGAAASVEGDARADTTVQPGLSSESGPGGVAPRDAFEQVVASENGEPMRPRGGAHRRQSGLLSTLTGFRRRGRGSRRD